MAKVVILSSNPGEFASVKKCFDTLTLVPKYCANFFSGKYGNHECFIGLAGVGLVNASIAATIAAQQIQPDLMIFCGVAGGVRPDIVKGDVVIASEVAQVEFLTLAQQLVGTPFEDVLYSSYKNCKLLDWYPSAKVNLSEIKAENFSIYQGRIGSTDTFPAPEKYYPLLLKSNVLALDMESAAIFQVGWLANIPTLAVRGISNCIQADASDPDMDKADMTYAPMRAAQVCMQLINSFSDHA